MASLTPSGVVAPAGARQRVVIGAQFTGGELDQARSLGAEVHSDELALARAVRDPASLLIVDRDWLRTTNLSGQWYDDASVETPMVLLSHAQLLKVVHEVAGLGAATGAPLVGGPLVDAFWATLRGAPRAPGGKLSSALVKPRAASEDREAKQRALEASFAERDRLLENSITTGKVGELLGMSRQAVHEKAKTGALIAIEHKGGLHYPMWQFQAEGPGGIVNGLAEVLRALEVGPFARARWLERPSPVFEGRSPLEVLKTGDVQRVVEEARSLGATAGHG